MATPAVPLPAELGLSDPRVRKLQPTRRDPGRVMIRVGEPTAKSGRVVATLPRERLAEIGVAVDMAWTDALAERVAAAVDADKAHRYALNALARRALSSGELRDRLRRREHAEAAVEATVERLVGSGLVDDLAYGRAFARQLGRRRPAGPRLLRQKLIQRKLPRPIVEQVVAELEREQDPVADARALLERQLALASVQRLEPRKRDRRLWNLLARRGFDADAIAAAMRAVTDADADQER